MVVFRIRNVHKRKCVLVFLCIFGFIMHRYFGVSVSTGRRRLSRRVGLKANTSQFTLEGEPFRIIGGAIHYFRIPRAYWRDRLLKMKACGINTVTTYVPWNLHQPQKGVFNFQTQLDLEAFVSLAAELGLWVILCPGPYISSELDLGGLPSWLLKDDKMKLRTTYTGFTEAVNVYFNKLIPKLVPLQFKKGGPVIAVQVENAYGSFAKDDGYMNFIKEALETRGIMELLLTSDSHNTLKAGGVDGAVRTLKLQKLNARDFQDLTALQPNSPTMVMDYWTGWYDTWGELHHILPPEDMVSAVREILRRGMSFSLYMFHGGSSFGFMSGALADPTYRALVPSYDYDAPLSESGEYTPKYHLLRDLLSRYSNGETFPDMPALYYREAYEPTIMYQHLSLWDALSFTEEPFKSQRPVSMEHLPVNSNSGQAYGYTLYETTITSGGLLKSRDNVRDRALTVRSGPVKDHFRIITVFPLWSVQAAQTVSFDLPKGKEDSPLKQVFVDRIYIGLFKRQTLEMAVPDGLGKRTLSLLVENCGRVHQGRDLNKQHKGLVGDILLNNIPLRDFTIYSLDMKPSFIDSLYQAPWKTLSKNPSFPGFFMGKLFAYGYPSDTFVKLPGWEKGLVFINGVNLGRYWSIGPQQALYLPGPFLNGGINQVIVFEEQESDYKVQFEDAPDLGMAADIQ